MDVTTECYDGNEERKMKLYKPPAPGCYEESQWKFVETGVLLCRGGEGDRTDKAVRGDGGGVGGGRGELSCTPFVGKYQNLNVSNFLPSTTRSRPRSNNFHNEAIQWQISKSAKVVPCILR